MSKIEKIEKIENLLNVNVNFLIACLNVVLQTITNNYSFVFTKLLKMRQSVKFENVFFLVLIFRLKAFFCLFTKFFFNDKYKKREPEKQHILPMQIMEKYILHNFT